MQTTTVEDVMTSMVIGVPPATPVKDIIDLIVGSGISAVPVLDDKGVVLGVVSEADLLCRQEHQDDDVESHRPIALRHRSRVRNRKAAGLTAADIMTTPALTVPSTAFLPSVARLLAKVGVRRLFVVDSGRLVGVVARRDLLRTFLRSDDDIRADIDHAVFDRVLHANPTMVRATVDDGVVTLTGRVDYQDDVDTAEHLVNSIRGVVAVKNRLDYCWDGEAPAQTDRPNRRQPAT
jgi:CBS domain-containing protein